MKRIALIVSSGRTGTQFLARYFDANYENVVARHEPAPAYRVRIAANAHAAGALSRERLVRMLERKRRRTIDPIAADLYVESNPFLWGAIDVFDEVFDRPVVVHVVRDPREQVRSSLGHGTARGLKGLANRWLPYWYPTVPGRSDTGDWVLRAAGLWAVVNGRLTRVGTYCADYRLLSYESLFEPSHSGLRRLCEWLGLEFRDRGAAVSPDERIGRAERDVLPGWREWSEARCAAFDRIAGPLMAEYGYGTEPEWIRRVEAGR